MGPLSHINISFEAQRIDASLNIVDKISAYK